MYEAGFIGVGNMGEAMVRGLASAIGGASIALCDTNEARPEALSEALGCAILRDPLEVAARCRVIVLAVKPQGILPLLKSLRDSFVDRPTVISVAAGVSLGAMASVVKGAAHVVRAMPNTPCLVGKGVSAWAADDGAGEGAARAAELVLGSVGLALRVDEAQIDAITSLSGSGPAYVFRFMEGFIHGGVALGLDEAVARRLAIATVEGAAALASASDDPPGTLRERVTSKGGTTAAALAVLDDRGLVPTVAAAMRAAAARSAEMTETYDAAAGELDPS